MRTINYCIHKGNNYQLKTWTSNWLGISKKLISENIIVLRAFWGGNLVYRGEKINFLKVISLLAQNEFYEEVQGLMYGAGIAD